MHYLTIRNWAEGFLYSLLLIWITTGFGIINPRKTGWLSDGDGTSEIGWEFFRRTPLIQFPLGINPDYGLEISSSVALDGQIPLLSFLLHPFSNILPERFQYFGLFLIITFVLNFIFAKKIFLHLKLSNIQAIISSTILASSPIILNRFIVHTHYSLASAWIIFLSILLVLRKDFRFSKWIYLFIFSVLIHMYYFPFLVVIYLLSMFIDSPNWKIRVRNIQTLIYVFICTGFVMFVAGYFYGSTSSKDVGYGFFRSTLSSLIDPSGWSILISDLPETEGSYEGFAFLGIPTLIILILNIFLFKKSKRDKSQFSFISLWAASIILFIFSLSNNIAFSNNEFLSLPTLESLSFITSSFRSTGRFSWLIVFIVVIYSIYVLSQKILSKYLTIILFAALVIGIIDYYPKITSEKNRKFQATYNSKLTNAAWNSISECYTKIRVYPPTPGVENYYDFLNMALSQEMAINTGRFGRINQAAVLSSYDLMHKEFKTGEYREDSFYVFTNADYVSPEYVEYQKNLSIHTLDEKSAYGSMDGYTFIAPSIKNCYEGEKIKSLSKSFGPPTNQKYNGEKLYFGKDKDSSKYVLTGFSALQDWGVWSVTKISEITLNTVNIKNFNYINVTARDLTIPANKFEVYVNQEKVGICTFSTEFSLCTIPFNSKSIDTNVVTLGFNATLLRSPKDVGLSNDTQNQGFGLQSLYLD